MKILRKSADAARLLAEDRLEEREICARVGIHTSTLWHWKQDADFNRLVDQLVRARMKHAFEMGLSRRERRIEDLKTLHDKLFTVIQKRSEDANTRRLPGGETGLVALSVKGVGSGENFTVVPVAEVDTGTINAILDVQERIADELGQKIKRMEMTGPDGAPLNFGTIIQQQNNFISLDLDRLTNDQLRQLRSIYQSYLSGESGVNRLIESGRPEEKTDSSGTGPDTERPSQT